MDEFTDFQKQAVNHRDGPAIVSAGAGSGKTEVLTQRILQYVLDGEDIDRFVVITFTKAAAEELKTRISAKLREADRSRQAELVGRAQIGTIHSFCAGILRENAQAADVNPDFSILSDERSQALKAEAAERIMDERYEDMDAHPGFQELLNTVAPGRNDRALTELMLDLYDKMQCHSDPFRWAEDRLADMERDCDDLSQTIWFQEIRDASFSELDYWISVMEALPERMTKDETVLRCYSQGALDIADVLREIRRIINQSWDAAVASRPWKIPSLGRLPNKYESTVADEMKAVRTRCSKAIGDLEKRYSQNSQETLAELRLSVVPMRALIDLVRDFDALYAADKKRMNALDFNDLEHKAVAFLQTRNISSKYREILVDEYQDVSRVQDEIFRAVSDGGKNLFVVGDIKQSIYGFRLADPLIFKEKLQNPDIENIPLQENFRSRREIIDGVNAALTDIMTDAIGDTDYRQNRLIFGAEKKYSGNVPAPELVLIPGISEEERQITEARFVASRIQELRAQGFDYGDIAILLRSNKVSGPLYAGVLAERGIPVITGQCEEFFLSPEISALISILRILDNPHNDIPLISALSSPYFGFSPDELAEIAKEREKPRSFYDALVASSGKNDKYADFLRRLEILRQEAPDLTADLLIRRIIGETDAETVCSLMSMSDGNRRMENVRRLISLATAFESDGYHGLHRFIAYLDMVREKGLEIPGGSKNDAVTIMSIHKSKGLGFRAVFLCDAVHRFNTSDSSATVLIHPDLGFGPKFTDMARRSQHYTVARTAISLRLTREMRSEEMRLLYVAMTRAKERLFLTACCENPVKVLAEKNTRPLFAAQSYVQWLIESQLPVRIASQEELLPPDRTEECSFRETPVADPEILQDLSFVYPWQNTADVPSKLTATELKHYESPDEDAAAMIQPPAKHIRLPEFAAGSKPLSPAERGIATHMCLQYMHFDRPVEEEISRLRAEGFLSERMADGVRADAIEKLLASEIGQRMKAADAVHREFRFSILCDAEDLIDKAPGEEILLQGVVDCCLEEQGQLVIIDYKTDNVKPGSQTEERGKLYTRQVLAYAKALHRIFGMPVKEGLLYFLSSGKVVTVPI